MGLRLAILDLLLLLRFAYERRVWNEDQREVETRGRLARSVFEEVYNTFEFSRRHRLAPKDSSGGEVPS